MKLRYLGQTYHPGSWDTEIQEYCRSIIFNTVWTTRHIFSELFEFQIVLNKISISRHFCTNIRGGSKGFMKVAEDMLSSISSLQNAGSHQTTESVLLNQRNESQSGEKDLPTYSKSYQVQ